MKKNSILYVLFAMLLASCGGVHKGKFEIPLAVKQKKEKFKTSFQTETEQLNTPERNNKRSDREKISE